MDINLITVAVYSYLLGSIPFGLVLTKIFLKKDIRNIGSGNIGATNVLRTGNKLIGYTTLFFDIIKSVIPVIYIKFYLPELLYITSLCTFLGHVFPIWLKFKGGKGVATYVGILFAINVYFGLVFVISWLITFALSKYSSLSSMTSSFCIPIFQYFFISDPFYYFYFIMFIMIYYTHRENIKRLINKKESKTKIY